MDPAFDKDTGNLCDDVLRRARPQSEYESRRLDLDFGPDVRACDDVAARSGCEQSIWTVSAVPESSSEMGPWRITLPLSTMATASQVR